MDKRTYLRSAEMNRGDLATDHSAKWDLSSSIESSSLIGSPIYRQHFLCQQTLHGPWPASDCITF